MGDSQRFVIIREANEAEEEAVRSVMLEAYEQYAAVLPAPVWEQYRSAISESASGNAPIARIVAEIDRDIVGSVQLYTSSEAAYGRTDLGIASPVIRYLSVSRRARGKGVATALIGESVRRSLELGATQLYLHTSDMMASAIRLYERLGFERAYDKEFHNGLYLVKSYRLSLTDQTLVPTGAETSSGVKVCVARDREHSH
ncbi:GNAT family N-acetyltransferase [Brevibacillus ruminantium]|uniref:GNAT family N-acetyltransferase n=1 Tax=Brevibacillus ruminantium TaxID=2950604 RepID=A0ABY4WIA1_9BACL|nr:GNAT family N-acetyltransferase [Brevibacillus ruminantium]USG66876.1 GNAT family N-acetyltransferase [Brevibacillus ruminantium]